MSVNNLACAHKESALTLYCALEQLIELVCPRAWLSEEVSNTEQQLKFPVFRIDGRDLCDKVPDFPEHRSDCETGTRKLDALLALALLHSHFQSHRRRRRRRRRGRVLRYPTMIRLAG
jgi:hypothetical protein